MSECFLPALKKFVVEFGIKPEFVGSYKTCLPQRHSIFQNLKCIENREYRASRRREESVSSIE